jgi:uncharacterized protein YjgD (DUF1641 family)
MKKILQNRSYKQKNAILLVGFIFVLIILWMAVFKNTFLLYKECNLFDRQLQTAEQAPQKNKELLIQLNELGEKLKNQQHADTNIQQAILSIVAPFSKENGLVLREFPRPNISQQNGYQIEINNIEIQGMFIPLLKLVYLLETKAKIGKIISVKFHAKNDSKVKSYVLTATIFIQNIKKT